MSARRTLPKRKAARPGTWGGRRGTYATGLMEPRGGRPRRAPVNALGRWLSSAEGVSVGELAARVGVSKVTIYNLMGGSMPSLSLAHKIAEVTDGDVRVDSYMPKRPKRRKGQP